MGPVLSAVCLGLGASLTLSLALRARSLGLARIALVALFTAVALVLVAVALLMSPNRDSPWLAVTAFAGGMALSAACAVFALRAPLERGPAGIGPLYRGLSLGFSGLAVLHAACVPGALYEGPSDLAVLLLSCAAVLGTGLIAGLSLGRRHAARGARRTARLGRGLALWSASCVLLPLLSGMEVFPPVVAGIVLLLFPLGLPIIVRYLVGAGPEPLDLAPHYESLGGSTMPRHAPLVTSCLLALGAQAFIFGHHFEHCNGALVLTAPAANWQNLPLAAEFDGRKLGPFVFEARHFDYKGYPAPYEDAALFDPKQCFGGGISLSAWFEDEMYHSPGELHLRSEPTSGVFMVSVTRSSETLLASFRRDPAPALHFDSRFNTRAISAGLALVAIAVASALRLRFGPLVSERLMRVLRTFSIVCSVLAILNAVMVEQHWMSNDSPRPGREIATEYPWIM